MGAPVAGRAARAVGQARRSRPRRRSAARPRLDGLCAKLVLGELRGRQHLADEVVEVLANERDGLRGSPALDLAGGGEARPGHLVALTVSGGILLVEVGEPLEHLGRRFGSSAMASSCSAMGGHAPVAQARGAALGVVMLRLALALVYARGADAAAQFRQFRGRLASHGDWNDGRHAHASFVAVSRAARRSRSRLRAASTHGGSSGAGGSIPAGSVSPPSASTDA
jgi:hypothetical protein